MHNDTYLDQCCSTCIQLQLAGSLVPKDVRPGASISLVTAALHIKDNKYVLEVIVLFFNLQCITTIYVDILFILIPHCSAYWISITGHTNLLLAIFHIALDLQIHIWWLNSRQIILYFIKLLLASAKMGPLIYQLVKFVQTRHNRLRIILTVELFDSNKISLTSGPYTHVYTSIKTQLDKNCSIHHRLSIHSHCLMK